MPISLGAVAQTPLATAAPGRDLLPSAPAEGSEGLRYVPDYGIAAGLWWGEPTGDMRPEALLREKQWPETIPRDFQ